MQRNIKKRIETLKIALKIIEEGKQILKSIKNNLKRTTVLNPDILKTLKKLSVLYLNLSTEFVNESMLFDFITVSEKIDIDYEMKMTQNLTIEGVNRLVELFASYFNNAEVRIAEVERLVNESLNTKS